jgi:hypothetical protein
MVSDWKSRITHDELDALASNSGLHTNNSIDKWAPWRFWIVFCVMGAFAIWLLTSPAQIAETLTFLPAEITKLSAYLYFRGWFLVSAITLGAYAYIKNWHTGLVLGGLTALSVVNTMFDMFTIFPDLLAKRSPFFTAIIVIRVSVMILVISLVVNRHRLPTGRDRLNLLLPFKK